MNNDVRPDPDELLRVIQEAEARLNRGRLHVFLGMCAGSGKTYAMLSMAHKIRADGRDVVVGFIETHGRVETEQLLHGLEVIPRRHVDYRNIQLEEPDIDAILARRPQAVLVDELAHTNAPGSRHQKRFQDVEELLVCGIDVYTALNVQHLESRAETVGEITGAQISETVPDSFLEDAEIELVDVLPDELLKRMKEGKVYVAERARAATLNFFRKGNLLALRELALRVTAEHVDMDMLDYMRAKHILATWKTSEKLMVAVGPSPTSQKLIRWTRRMAFNLGAQWIAACIDLGTTLSVRAQEGLARNQELAASLGGKVIQIADSDVVSGLLQVAMQNNVTQIVIGKTNEHPIYNFLTGGSIVDRLLRQSENIDIYVVKADKVTPSKYRYFHMPTPISRIREYLLAATVVLSITAVSFPFRDIVGYQTIGTVFLIGIALLSLFVGRFPIILSALLSSFVWNFFFIPPLFTFYINKPQDITALIANCAVALAAGTLINRLRKSQSNLRRSQDQMSVLLSILESFNNTVSIKDIVKITRTELKKYFDADAVIFLHEKFGEQLDSNAFGNTAFVTNKEYSVAEWCYKNRKSAGRFTPTLPGAELPYYPLVERERVIGVIGIKFYQKGEEILTQEKATLLHSFVSQLTLSLLREINIEAREQKQIDEESTRLFRNTINHIARELSEPVSVVAAMVSNMAEDEATQESQSHSGIRQKLNDVSIRLNVLHEHVCDLSGKHCPPLE